jgi:glycosyltransferase involved in cell wall biosynthesis
VRVPRGSAGGPRSVRRFRRPPRCHPQPLRHGGRAKLDTLRRPYSYLFAPELRRDLGRALASGFDVLHLEQLWSGWLGLDVTRRTLLGVHHLQRIDLATDRPRTPRQALDRALLLRTELRLLRAFPNLVCCSERVAEEVGRLAPQAQVAAVPHAVDLSAYPLRSRGASDPTVLLCGQLGWQPNRSAATRLLTRLWPRIQDGVPGARLVIAGWSAREVLREFLDVPGATILQDVADVRPLFESASLLLYAPQRASGIKMKVIEAMARGVPVVTTPEGVEGLPARDGVHALVADDDDGLVERAVSILRHPARTTELCRAARELVERTCDPAAVTARLEQLHVGIADRAGVGT